MRVRVTCEICGHRMRLERTEFIPGQCVPLVCHNCETPIAIVIPRAPNGTRMDFASLFGRRGYDYLYRPNVLRCDGDRILL